MTRPASHRSRLAWRIVFACVVLGVSWLALAPRPPNLLDSGWDKANHVLAFAAAAFAGVGALGDRHGSARVWLALALLAWGALLELGQGLQGTRHADPVDWLADAVGVCAGLALASRVWPRPGVADAADERAGAEGVSARRR